MKVHESSWFQSFMKVFKTSWLQSFMNVHVLMFSWLNEANHSNQCDGLLTRAHGLTLYFATAAFLGAATPQFSRHKELLPPWRPFEPATQNVFALPRIVKRSHRPVVIVYRTSSSCNFAFKQRVHVQICLSVFRCHGFMERTVVTLATPSVKRKSPWPNSPPQQRIVETRTIEISWFYWTGITPVLHCSAIALKQSFMISWLLKKLFMKVHDFQESSWFQSFMKVHKISWFQSFINVHVFMIPKFHECSCF